MIVEIYYGLQAVTSLVIQPAEGSSGLVDDGLETERDRSHRRLPGWDEVAARWPEGGRFPSFIFIDQTA